MMLAVASAATLVSGNSAAQTVTAPPEAVKPASSAPNAPGPDAVDPTDAKMLLAWRRAAQAETARKRPQIDKNKGIEELKTVKLNGIDHWISIRGQDRRNPILLYLHGGPGTPMIPFSHNFQGPWESDFTVVQWDQRCAGKTYFRNLGAVDCKKITYEDMQADALALINHLRSTYGKSKIVLLGHSWGTILGTPLVAQHPELFHAYVGTGQVVSVADAERVGYEETLAEARRRGDQAAIKALAALAPYPDGTSDWGPKRSILLKHMEAYGKVFRSKDYASLESAMLDMGMRSPDYEIRDLTYFELGDATESKPLNGSVAAFDARKYGTSFKVPMFFLLGRHDVQTPSTLAETYYRSIKAPRKEIHWFEDSAHSPVAEEPASFARILKTRVRPLARD